MTNNKLLKIFGYILIITFIVIIMYSINHSFNYYYSITEYLNKPFLHNKENKIIGKVYKILKQNHDKFEFIIKEKDNQIRISYQGKIPRMFSLDQEIIATGELNKNIFIATNILVKHDEKYSPNSSYKNTKNTTCHPHCNAMHNHKKHKNKENNNKYNQKKQENNNKYNQKKQENKKHNYKHNHELHDHKIKKHNYKKLMKNQKTINNCAT